MHTGENATRKLNANPVGTSMEHVVTDLKMGRTIQVQLEPGDSTRYDFILSFVNAIDGERYLVVTRTNGGIGGGLRSSAILCDPETSDPVYLSVEYGRLADGNDWTYEVLEWWFGTLWAWV